MAQSVYYSLFYAYPKSRGQTNNDDMKRKLLNIFSKLFTGMKIQSANYEHWTPFPGTGSVLHSLGGGKKTEKNPLQQDHQALIELHQGKAKGKKQANRERIHMKYSPLVERYLMSHKYETMNNVREWKMLLTQRREAGKSGAIDSSKKFERYRKIAETAVTEMKKISQEYDNNCRMIAEKVRENEKAAAKHIQTLQ